MTFYSGLRDDTAGPLIAQFGQDATYRVYASESYNNVTGTVTPGTPTDLPIKLLDLPIDDRDFTEDIVAKSNAKLLVAAKEFAAAGREPAVGETVILNGGNYRILAFKTVAPAGTAVIYTMAVQNA